MILYATTTSERASKGQGGNEYLYINIQDKRQVSFGHVLIENIDGQFYPTMKVFSSGVLNIVTAERMQTLVDIKTKGKQKKGECKCIPKCKEQEEGFCKHY